MLPRRELHLYLGFLAESAAPGANRAEFDFLHALRESLGTHDVPVHWFLPPMLFEEVPPPSYADLVAVLGERLRSGLDRSVAVGFRGSFHPLLGLREVGRDLRWAVRNPWNSGTARAFPEPPVAVFPFHPDLGRPGMLRLYRESGFGTLIFLCRPNHVTHYAPAWQEPESGLRFVPAIPASAGVLPALRSMGADLRVPSSRTVFLLAGGAGSPPSAIRDALASLRKRYTLSFHALPEMPCEPSPVTREELRVMSAAALPCTPAARHRWLRAEQLRRSTRNADVRTLLGAIAHRDAGSGASPIPDGELEERPRLHSSIMPGTVTLPGSAFDARLDGGSLCGLARGGAPLFPLTKLRSYLACDRAIRPYMMDSSASFEEGETRGLRAILSQGKSSVIIDYAFHGSFPALIVDFLASYALLDGDCRAVVPFGLAVDLTRAVGSQTIRCFTQEGTSQLHTIPAAEPPSVPRTVAGTAFVVSTGSANLCLSFPPRRGLTCRPLQWMILKEGNARTLLLNPFGTFHPSEVPGYSTMQEQLTMVLSTETEPPSLPRAVLRGSLEHRILRRPGEAP